jgi:predicted dehydrogenase
MSEPVGIALIGMGWWGKKMLNVLEAAPQDIRVVRGVEPNIETVRALCADKGVTLTTEYADALADPEVEAVVLATPHALHGAQIEAAVAAGKHVFCEKPLALTKAGAEKSVRLCRWEPPIAELLAKADAGNWGAFLRLKPTSATTDFWRSTGITGV